MTANPTHKPNGHIPDDDLVMVASAPLWWGSAHAFDEMAAAAMKVGIGIAPINAWSGYRDFALQQAMIAHPGNYEVQKVNGHYVTQKAAGQSTHGWATALDMYSGRAWVIAHGAQWGWHWTLGNADPNHFEHDGKTAIGTNPASVGKVTPALPPEDEMLYIKTAKAYYVIGETTVNKLTGTEPHSYSALRGVNFKTGTGAEVTDAMKAVARVASAADAALIEQMIAAGID